MNHGTRYNGNGFFIGSVFCPVQECIDGFVFGLCGKDVGAGKNLVKGAAEGPGIYFFAVGADFVVSEPAFIGSMTAGAEHVVGGPGGRGGEGEIGEFEGEVGVDKNIMGFDVAVNDVVVVECIQRL